MPRADFPSARKRVLLALAFGLAGSAAFAAEPKQPATMLDDREFFAPDLYISSSQVPLADVLDSLPNRARWQEFQGGAFAGWINPAEVQVWIDPRSGAATNIMGAFPLIPGNGVGNRVTAAALGMAPGARGGAADTAAVERAVRAFIRKHADLLGIDVAQLGEARVSQINDDLWQIYIPQVYQGLPVRHGHLVASISHGNLVTVGADTWGNVRALEATPLVPAEAALQAGFAFVEGPAAQDVLLQPAKLEVVPFAPSQFQNGNLYQGPLGQGYGHRLVWSLVFQRPPEDAQWEILVDATSGEVLALQDINHYVQRQVTGGVYPITSTGICPNPLKCGTMQTGWPMPFANTGLAAPNNFANSAGIFDWTSGTVTTTLNGRYVRIVDTCGAMSLSSTTGTLSLGGTNNQHDCTTPGVGGAGNTPAARSAFYEVNKIEEMARGWLPNNTWLTGSSVLTANVNINATCNGFWNGSTINFYRSGGGCRNTGELAGVFDHEWGHGMDDNDANGTISNSGEGYADIAAILRYQDSCVGHGFFQPPAASCGLTADGTGRNTDEDQTAGVHCATDCSGVRDADWGKHSDNQPDTALGHVCTRCNTGTGPCGRQVHCAAAPQRQAAWDLVARDLPFDSQTNFMIGNRLFYQGSGNVGSWYSCTCGGTSSGCGATNGYMQWITADDDNGNLNDGTPHIASIRAAFNRHGIGCATPTAGNSGCSGQPNGGTGPTLSASPGSFSASLSWNSVAGATRYWVLRTEGHAGCNYGKALIATVTGTSFTDTQVANGRAYSYNVVAVGPSASCFSRVSNCVTVTPGGAATPDFSVNCPASATVTQGSSTTATCSIASTNGFNSAVDLSCTNPSSGVSCAFNPDPATPPANGSINSTLTITAATGATTGTFNLNVQGVGGGLTRSDSISLTVNQQGGGGNVFFDNFETDLGWTRNPLGTDTATTGLWERANPEPTTSSGTKQQGTTVSGVNDLVTGPLAGASAGVHDIDTGVTTIQSPAITLPSSGTLTLSFSYYLAHGTNSSTADFLRVFVVGGTTTQVFEELGAANNDDAAFATFSANISAFAGQTVRIRIQAADASTASLVEAAVDDVRITQQ
jgi:trimeric autotransporter adhesin